MRRKFFSYLHVSDHPLPRVVTAALVAAHVSVGAGTVVAAPPGLQAGVGAVLARVLLTCSHTLHPLWPLTPHRPRASAGRTHRCRPRGCRT